MHLRVRYHRAGDLIADHRAQLVRGTLLVRVELPEDVSVREDVELELAFGDARARCRGEIVKLFPGSGVGVRLERDASLVALEALVAHARSSPDVPAPPPAHELVRAARRRSEAPPSSRRSAPRSDAPPSSRRRGPESDAPPPSSRRRAKPAPERPRDARTRLAEASAAELVKIALHGSREERALIMHGQDLKLQSFVLGNPALPPEEVAAYAAIQALRPPLLEQIAARREWAEDARVAAALVRNPKTPLRLAMALLIHVSSADLRRIAKDARTRTAVQNAAKKRLLG